MTYNPATDFVGLWRNGGGSVSKLEMPTLDIVVAALARAGVISLTVSATAPVANQATTAWLKAAVPSYSAEGQFFLWDKVTTAYLPATAGLFLQLLEATAGESGISWWTTAGGPPSNAVGLNGDYAIRTDVPGGIYGPKALGAWPANPLPGTTNTIESGALDNSFGNTEGLLIYRDAALWEGLAIGGAGTLLFSNGIKPGWETLSALMDAVFGSVQGSVLYRDVALWNDLAPGTANNVLTTNGPGANPNWTGKSSEFPSGVVMLFQQTSAPPGWTKQTAINDYGLRVTAGVVGTTPGSAFSTVFAQTVVGDTSLSVAQMPAHTHTGGGAGVPAFSGQPVTPGTGAAGQGVNGITTLSTIGGGAVHAHSINLSLSYVDVIIATKN